MHPLDKFIKRGQQWSLANKCQSKLDVINNYKKEKNTDHKETHDNLIKVGKAKDNITFNQS